MVQDNKKDQLSLRIRSLQLEGFRSYKKACFEGLGDLTVFIGKNGIGKTNVLEALALMTSTQSFRHAQIAQLINEVASTARITTTLTNENRLLKNELVLEPGKKRYFTNGKAKKTQDMQGILPAVVFTPDDLSLIKGSSSHKRDAFDQLGTQLTPNYYIVRRDYEKVLRYKNKLLKDEAPQPLIDSINETLITCGSQLFCYRTSLVSRLLPLIKDNYAKIAHAEDTEKEYAGAQECVCAQECADAQVEPLEEFSSVYRASWQYLLGEGSMDMHEEALPSRDEVRTSLEEALKEYGPQEAVRKRSLVGPHNDKIEFKLGGRDASLYASQGQQRSLVLAWKLAEVSLIFSSKGIYPVLLLDDVMSELDTTRRDMLVRFVTDDIQTFITATDLSSFNEDLLKKADIRKLPLE